MTTFRSAAAACTVAVLIAGCAQEDADSVDATVAADSPAAQHDAAHSTTQLSSEDQQAVSNVRQTAEGFSDVAAARAAGYTRQYPEGCVQTAEGSQGFHFLNESLLDDRVDLATPELVMYEPQADGSMQLIGVDYVIPFDRWTGSEPPQVLGRPMMRNEPLGVWALHIWTHRDNPSGMFAAYNPQANCDHAAAARL